MSKEILIETELFDSITSEIEGCIGNISIDEWPSEITGSMPALKEYISLYRKLIYAMSAFKTVNHEDIVSSKTAINEIQNVDSELLG